MVAELKHTLRTSGFSSMIVDDCRSDIASKTWPDDEANVLTVRAWNPLLPAHDHDDELIELSGVVLE